MPGTRAIVTEPTPIQVGHISRGEPLPFTFKIDGNESTQLACRVIYRGETGGDKFPQILNHIKVHTAPLDSAILLVNKQALRECSKMLYGENTFSFRFIYMEARHESSDLSHYPHLIPGFPRKIFKQTQYQLSANITRLFTQNAFLPEFVARDPMLQFFHRIGRQNTSLLTKVKIEGFLETGSLRHPYLCSGKSIDVIGFPTVLPILTTVLTYGCPNLKELTLHMSDERLYRHSNGPRRWDEKMKKSPEEKIDEMVEKVATSLGSLKVLHLGCWSNNQFVPIPSVDEWGRSTRWIKFVKERAAKQLKGTEAEPVVEPLPWTPPPPPADQNNNAHNSKRSRRRR